jgi:putative endopeptidase
MLAYNYYPYLERFYLDHIVDEQVLQEVRTMCQEVVDEYKTFIEDSPFYNPKLKIQIKHKLDNMQFIVGATEKNLDDYILVESEDYNDYYKNVCSCMKTLQKSFGSIIEKGKFSNEEGNPAYKSNAFYYPRDNYFFVTAGYLLEPIYKKDYSLERKYAIIGFTIAHEISHSFDANMIKLDRENYKVQKEWQQSIINLYDGYPNAYGIKTNGKIVVSEANADLFGLNCALKIMQKKVANPDYKEFFMAAALKDRAITTKEYLFWWSKNDSHPLPKSRCNCLVVNFPEFYEAFDIKPGDGMYVSPEKRIELW